MQPCRLFMFIIFGIGNLLFAISFSFNRAGFLPSMRRRLFGGFRLLLFFFICVDFQQIIYPAVLGISGIQYYKSQNQQDKHAESGRLNRENIHNKSKADNKPYISIRRSDIFLHFHIEPLDVKLIPISNILDSFQNE